MIRSTKVLAVLVLALVMLGGAVKQSQAGPVYEDGCLVPYAFYNADTNTTVGLMALVTTGTIYWNFMSPDGVQLGHGIIPLTGAFKIPFSLKDRDGNTNPDQEGGYIIFTYDNDGTFQVSENRAFVTANAVLLTTNDAAFLPVLPLDRSDYANADLNLNALNGNSIVLLSYAQAAGIETTTNFWIDPAFGAQTQIVTWCAQTPPATISASMHSVAGGSEVAVSFNRKHQRLNVYDVATETEGLPPAFLDGLVDIVLPENERFVFSLISSSDFNATQTLLGANTP